MVWFPVKVLLLLEISSKRNQQALNSGFLFVEVEEDEWEELSADITALHRLRGLSEHMSHESISNRPETSRYLTTTQKCSAVRCPDDYMKLPERTRFLYSFTNKRWSTIIWVTVTGSWWLTDCHHYYLYWTSFTQPLNIYRDTGKSKWPHRLIVHENEFVGVVLSDFDWWKTLTSEVCCLSDSPDLNHV